MKSFFSGIAGILALAVIGNAVYGFTTGINIRNNYESKIEYAVNSDTNTAIQQFTEVKSWLVQNNATKGRVCLFPWEQQPTCQLEAIASGRIDQTLKELQELKTINDPLTTSNGFLKIRERHVKTDKDGALQAVEPVNFNLYLRYHNFLWLGWILDWTGIIVFIFIVLLILSK